MITEPLTQLHPPRQRARRAAAILDDTADETFVRELLRVDFPPSPEAVPALRQAVGRSASDAGLSTGALDNLRLCASELIANAVQHTGMPATVVLALFGDRLRLEVEDSSPRLPRYGSNSDAATQGRGLRLVAALAQQTGWYTTGAGKTVWCEIAVAGAQISGTQRSAVLRERRPYA